MAKLNNSTQIKSEDYDEDYSELVDQLAETLNPFMQEVVEMADDRIDFENRVEVLKTVEITVDSAGKPTLNDKINVEKSGIRGITVIRTYNLTNVSGYPTGTPWISYTNLGGTTIRVDNITGLLANNKYQLTLIIY